YDLVHHPLPAHSAGVRNVVTVHDLAFDLHPELFARGFATHARLTHARAARRPDAAVAVSHPTANDALTRCGLPSSRLGVARRRLPVPGPARSPRRLSPARDRRRAPRSAPSPPQHPPRAVSRAPRPRERPRRPLVVAGPRPPPPGGLSARDDVRAPRLGTRCI